MANPATDNVFTGSIPRRYETCLVPMLFESYAVDLVGRLTARPLSRVLEIAAGTGVVTRRMTAVLPDTVAIVATDLNQAMLDHAVSVGTQRPVEWRQANALQLPFADGTFDAVAARSRAASSRIAATAYCQGTPLRNEIESRDASRLEEATDVAAEAIARRFGPGAVDGKIQAHVITIAS
ncbi:MAG: methyltransferase domain-containing protein [Gammaproteobacteria bacterium]